MKQAKKVKIVYSGKSPFQVRLLKGNILKVLFSDTEKKVKIQSRSKPKKIHPSVNGTIFVCVFKKKKPQIYEVETGRRIKRKNLKTRKEQFLVDFKKR